MSEIGKYNYLKKYIENEDTINFFKKIKIETIIESEKNMGFKFPSQLKEFWEEIGTGFLRVSKNNKQSVLDNLILSPGQIAEILLDKEEAHNEGLMLLDISEEIPDGYIAFFHIGDSSDFLFMKPNSENPNAVYEMDGSKVEDNFETFIYRLYHESPLYYNHYYINDKK